MSTMKSNLRDTWPLIVTHISSQPQPADVIAIASNTGKLRVRSALKAAAYMGMVKVLPVKHIGGRIQELYSLPA